MEKEIMEIFDVDTDAPATNRGFYYQYLVLLKKWIENYILGADELIFSEVDDDIKQVGEKLIFTQVKSYSKNFSLQSTEIIKSIFNYYLLFIKEEQTIPINFCFCTNSGVVKSEKLLEAWCDNPELTDKTLRTAVTDKVKLVLIGEINSRKRKKLEKKGLTEEEKKKIKTASVLLKTKTNEEFVNSFVNCIKWEFSSEDPDSAITTIWNEIRNLFGHEKFNNKSITILESVLLSEIYRCSQLQNKEDRVLTNESINELLEKTDSELKSCQNKNLLNLIDYRFEKIDQKFKVLMKSQENNFEVLSKRIDNVDVVRQVVYPKELSLIPPLFDEPCHGRDSTISELNRILINSSKLYVYANGGEGKTFFVRNYLNEYRNNFDHVIWVNSSPSLQKSFALDLVIQRNLNLEFEKSISSFEKLQIICNELMKLKGDNLLIIDNYENDLSSLRLLTSLHGWNVLITTREIIEGIVQFKLPKLDYSNLKKIYEDNFNKEVEDERLFEFFTAVEFNPLVVKLCAKTIASSVDLNLATLIEYFKNQKLDDQNLEIEVSVANEDYPIKLLSYLQSKFEYRNLERVEEQTIEFLALLPSDEIVIDDLAQIGGVESYEKNLVFYTNTLNALHRKGWLERTNGAIKVHRLVQELIIYNTRGNVNGFISCMFQVIWLYHRIDETAQNNPSLSFKYLRYAESILKSIKEPYRDSLYQPLLLLENALLYSYGWIEKSDDLHLRWIDLMNRAKNHLADTDINLGIIYNNLGNSYAQRSDLTNAIDYFKTSIDTFLKTDATKELINSMNNLSQAFLSIGDIENARKTIDESFSICKKKSLNNTPFNAALFYLNGGCFLKEKNLGKATESFENAIEVHLKLDREFQNEFYLFVFYAELIHCLFVQRNHDRVLHFLNEISLLYEDMELFDDVILGEIIGLIKTVKEYYADIQR